jgi:tRNA (cmo5U34)-methyltransferase|tara:strand:+ start:203 stop:922 length:720 start_codon:yes stop_codon:yes gene_type:complete
MKKIVEGLPFERANWKFNGELVDSFDKHIAKSVPLYEEGHNLICDMSDFFIKPKSLCYEIGCSTGTLTLRLAAHHQNKPEAHFIGIDIEEDMIKKAESKLSKEKDLNVSFLAEDVMNLEINEADLIICYYTAQFIKTSVRQNLMNSIYEKLNWGGALFLFEKVRGADARFQDILTSLYNDYKLREGYSAEEIIGKSRSLKGVLEPFSTQGNLDMLKRAGFIDINTVQKYLCFEGFLAIK